MTIHLSLTNLALRVWSAFFAAVCILASVYADTVDLYEGDDVGVVLNSNPNANVLNIYGSVTHSQKAAIGVLKIYGDGGTAQKINVQSLDPTAPYVFTKPTDDFQLYMTNIEYCGNANQNVRSIFARDQYTGSSSSSMAMTFHNVTVSSFNAPDSEAYSVFNVTNINTTITLLSDDGYPNTFSNNRGCARARAINFNPATTANESAGDWKFNNNYATNGSVLNCYQLLLKDEGKYTFTENTATLNGGAIYSTGNYEGTGSVSSAAMCQLNDNELTLRFERNTAGENGGAIYGYESEIRLSGENTFKNNRAGIGLDGNLLSNNIASGKGGAICCETLQYSGSFKLGYVFISDAVNIYESNLAYGDGGAIYCEGTFDLRDCTNSKFYKNVAGYTDESTGNYHQGIGGAIYSFQYIYLKDSPSEFSENSAYSGGAIYCESLVRIWESPSEFSKNSAANSGGAIYITDNYIYIRNSESEFSENSAANSGGAIYSEGYVYVNNSPLTVSDNKASQGGAIYSPYVEFYGADGSATFTGNYGNYNNAGEIDYACGNDLYLTVNDAYTSDDVATNLGFSNVGSYSFDGGIYIELGAYSGNPYNTAINQAQVTIAGRANDTTNYYQLRRANIFNGGKLTAKLDEIEGVNGIFVMDDNSAKLELNVTGANTKKLLTMSADDVSGSAQDSDLAVQGSGVIEKTGDGTLQILAEAEGLVCAESFVVSSGRLDYKGYYTGAVEVGGSEADAVFSPGNSVGEAYVDGNVKILNSGAALFEFGAFPGVGSDSNHDVLNITNGNFSAGDQRISLLFENSVAEDWSYEDCKYLLVSGANLPDGDFTSWLDGDFTGLFSLLSEDHNLYLVYPIPIPTPEPSTIALLILGAAGLLYVRKRKNF
ncbi:MAG: PEP-CTERM sorting domain-containing protein [Thermoguttaceae bacterium]|nr:PEP-CTERM sorting domain-containing protein [Thermoguttaceae bacterium]